jgi:predicted dehydrogenase
MRRGCDCRVDEDVAATWGSGLSRLVGNERGTRDAATGSGCLSQTAILEVLVPAPSYFGGCPRADGSFVSALLEYPTFSVTYESGLDNVPRFDAHIEVYSMTKTVRVTYDTPYIKGLPVTLTTSENINGVYRESTVILTHEDPYTLEMKELYQVVANGKEVKTTAKDAKKDLEIFQMIMKTASRSSSLA